MTTQLPATPLNRSSVPIARPSGSASAPASDVSSPKVESRVVTSGSYLASDSTNPVEILVPPNATALQIWNTLLAATIESGASDLHLSANRPQFWRLHGKLQVLKIPGMAPGRLDEFLAIAASDEQRESFRANKTLDLAFTGPNNQRFRINAFLESGGKAMALRRLEEKIRSIDELNLPSLLLKLTELNDGLILVTGPTGSGKSTTLATLIAKINLTSPDHIITIEDPIEYIHVSQQSLIHQRELGTDVPSFAQAVKDCLREDPDVLLVGEMRDLETMRAAITAAETGHLVFSTLHTGDAVGAIDRMIGAFPAEEQQAIRAQLSMSLRAVIAQRLVPSRDGKSRVPVIELLTVNSAVANLIRTGRPSQIYSTMEAGAALGMITREQSLAELLFKGKIAQADANVLARDVQIVNELVRMKQAPAAK